MQRRNYRATLELCIENNIPKSLVPSKVRYICDSLECMIDKILSDAGYEVVDIQTNPVMQDATIYFDIEAEIKIEGVWVAEEEDSDHVKALINNTLTTNEEIEVLGVSVNEF